MATVDITGTIQTADSSPVVGAIVRISPQAPPPGGEEAIGGVGIALQAVEVQTDGTGDFTATVVVGFQYLLEIPVIGYNRVFRAPAVASVRFDLLGLVPDLQSAVDYVDPAGDTKIDLTIKADPIGTVLERFDGIQVARSDAGPAGPWVDEGFPIQLENDVAFYVSTVDGPITDHFRAYFVDSVSGDESQPSPAILGNDSEDALLLTVKELEELYLFGVDLTDDEGNEFPARMLRHYITAAIDWLEKELDIDLVAKQITNELHDHYAVDYSHWGYFQLRHYPIVIPDGTPASGTGQEAVAVAFQYPSQDASVAIDNQWIVVEDEGQSGVIQIVPGQGNLTDALLIPGNLLPMWSGAFGRVPGIWRFTYKAGFLPGQLPPDLKHAIGMHASIGVLNIAGDLIAGAGIASFSISVPGLNQNVNTTSSATNSGYGARIIEYQKELKEMLPNLRRYYGKGSKLYVV
jgi:hypothetical protein